jgi:hypothetical protein
VIPHSFGININTPMMVAFVIVVALAGVYRGLRLLPKEDPSGITVEGRL